MHEYLQRQRGTGGDGLVDNAGTDQSIIGVVHYFPYDRSLEISLF